MRKALQTLLVTFVLAAGAAAQEGATDVAAGGIQVGVDASKQRPLSLAEAVEAALANAKDLTVSRQNSRIAEFDLRAARGAYEPRFTGQTFYDQTKTPNISIFSTNQSTTNRTFLTNAGIQGLIGGIGTSYSSSLTSQRLTTDNPISILSPQVNTNINFALAQPLLKGRSIDQTRRTVSIARNNRSLTDAQLRLKAMETVTGVQRAYWDLVFTLRNLQVQNEAVRDARRQLEHLRRLVEEGQLAPNDILAGETQVALLEQAVYEATDLVGRAENALKIMIATDKDDALWNEVIVPTESAQRDAPRPPLEAAVAEALEKRPEIAIVAEQRNINATEQKYFRDQTMPQLDLTASYTSAGVGGAANPRFDSPFPSPCQTNPSSPACLQQLALLNGLTGSSFADVWAGRYPSFRVGLTFSFSVGRKTAEAQLGKAKVQGEQIRTQTEQVEQFVQVDVRNVLQALRTAEAKLRAAGVARENSQKQYESEQRKLDAGQSDVYRVLERQTALVAARGAELRAQTELNKSIADYERAVGRSLEANGVTWK
jgi:HAE1 family hydrophobic/amphiphilic exporter-1